jgi:hypothetical protein
MKGETMREEGIDVEVLQDDLFGKNSLSSFFDLMMSTESSEKIEMGNIAMILLNEYERNIEEVIDFITKHLGIIEIQRKHTKPFSDGYGKIIGIKFTASKLLNEALEDKKPGSDLTVEIRPVKDNKVK